MRDRDWDRFSRPHVVLYSLHHPVTIITTVVLAKVVIQVNRIHVNTAFTSTGQLIALFAALSQFAITFWRVFGPVAKVRVCSSLS